MELLNKLKEKLGPMYPAIKRSSIVIAIAFAVGTALQYFTDTKDSKAEQIIEAVLRTQGIEHDFSPD